MTSNLRILIEIYINFSFPYNFQLRKLYVNLTHSFRLLCMQKIHTLYKMNSFKFSSHKKINIKCNSLHIIYFENDKTEKFFFVVSAYIYAMNNNKQTNDKIRFE